MEEKKQEYNFGIAILKQFMCFEVVCCHIWLDMNYSSRLQLFMTIRTWAVTVFMTISFFLIAKYFEKPDVKQLGKRIWRLYWPLFSWAMVYYIVYVIVGRGLHTNLVDRPHALLWQMTTGHCEVLNPSMWFQFDIIWLTLLFYFVFWIAGEWGGLAIVVFLALASLVAQSKGWTLLWFGNLQYELKYPLGRFFEMLPYAVLGYVLYRYRLYEKAAKIRYYIWGAVLVFTGYLVLRCQIYPPQNGYGYNGTSQIGYTLLLTTIGYYMPLEKVGKWGKRILVCLSKYTLGIYCIHRLVAFFITLLCTRWGLATGTFGMCVVVFFISYLVCALIYRIPCTLLRQMVA